MPRAKTKELTPLEEADRASDAVFNLWINGHTIADISLRVGIDSRSVKSIVAVRRARLAKQFTGPIPKLAAAYRLNRVAEFCATKAEEPDASLEDIARLEKTTIEAQEALNKLLGLNAPVRTSSETVVSSTVVRREEHLLLMRDPEFRELQSKMDQHVINVHTAEAPDARGLRAQSLSGQMGLPAPPGDPEPADDGAGDP